jgi:hypothetical protein
MKMRYAILILALFMSLTALAQPQRMSPQERTDQLAKELGLTAEQKAKVLDVFTQQQKNMPKPGEGGDFDAMREKMMKMREERNAKLKEILTKEQYAKYEKMAPPRRGGPGGPGGPPPQGEPGKEK